MFFLHNLDDKCYNIVTGLIKFFDVAFDIVFRVIFFGENLFDWRVEFDVFVRHWELVVSLEFAQLVQFWCPHGVVEVKDNKFRSDNMEFEVCHPVCLGSFARSSCWCFLAPATAATRRSNERRTFRAAGYK